MQQKHQNKTSRTPINLNEFVSMIEQWEHLTGNKHSAESVKDQIKVLVEEVKETVSAVDESNPKLLLDGLVDTAFCAISALIKLHKQGFDVVGAAEATAENNLSKFVHVEDQDAATDLANAAQKNTGTIRWSPCGEFMHLQDSEGKVRKHPRFVSNDLSRFVPMSNPWVLS